MAKFKIKILAFLIFLILKVLYFTCHKEFFGEKTLPKEPCVVLFWHGKLALMAFIFAYLKKNGYKKQPYVLISSHKDGELIASVMQFFGIKAVRGSTYDSPVAALRKMKEIILQGGDIYITPDGPRGPYHSISKGSYKFAQKNALKTVIIDNYANKFYQAKSWDKMILAKPFSKVFYAISEPFSLDKNANASEILEQKFAQIEEELKGKASA